MSQSSNITNIKRGKYQQITQETNPGKLQSRKGWIVVTADDCIGVYDTKFEAQDAGLGAIAIIPVVVDFYLGDGL